MFWVHMMARRKAGRELGSRRRRGSTPQWQQYMAEREGAAGIGVAP